MNKADEQYQRDCFERAEQERALAVSMTTAELVKALIGVIDAVDAAEQEFGHEEARRLDRAVLREAAYRLAGYREYETSGRGVVEGPGYTLAAADDRKFFAAIVHLPPSFPYRFARLGADGTLEGSHDGARWELSGLRSEWTQNASPPAAYPLQSET